MPGRAERKAMGVGRWTIGGAWLLAVLALSVWLSIAAGHPTTAAASDQAAPVVRLVMVEDPGCPYCALWDKEVGGAYAASAEGRFAPLVRRRRDDPDVKKLGKIVYSPTFIVVRDGVEVGRIVGYPGPDFFWGLLEGLLKKVGFRPELGAS